MRRFVTRLLIALACTAFSFFLYRNVHAAAVVDTFFYTPCSTNGQTGYSPSQGVWRDAFTFVSSTLQLELTDVSFLGVNATFDTTTTQELVVSTDKGTWTATTSAGGYAAYTTSTFTFPYPHPWATPGSPWEFEISGPATSTLFQYFWCGTSTTDTRFVDWTQKASIAGDSPLTGHPAVRINASGSGALESPIPNMTDYGFTTGTATGEDFGWFGNMFRDVWNYLFKPSGYGMAANLAEMQDLAETKFPFSYVAGLQSDIAAKMTETSTTALGVTIDFSGMVSTSTMFGNFMPTSTILFDASTTKAYGTTSVFAFLRFLVGLALWLGLVDMIYYGARGILRKE